MCSEIMHSTLKTNFQFQFFYLAIHLEIEDNNDNNVKLCILSSNLYDFPYIYSSMQVRSKLNTIEISKKICGKVSISHKWRNVVI